MHTKISSGTVPFTLAGVALMTLAALLLRPQKKVR